MAALTTNGRPLLSTPLTATLFPASPTITGTTVTSSSITVTWMEPGGGGAVSSFAVGYGVDGIIFTTIAGLASTTGTYTFSGLPASTTYFVRVLAINDGGVGITTVGGVTTAAVAGPAAPGPVTGLAAGSATQTSVALTWAATTGADSYTVGYRITGKTLPATLVGFTTFATGVTAVALTVTGLAAGTPYDLQVTAVNASGQSSAIVTQQTLAAPPALPGAPTSLAAGSVTTTSAVLTWFAATSGGTPATFSVYRAAHGSNIFVQAASGLTAATYTDTTLAASGVYDFAVTGVNVTGEGPKSTVLTVVAAAAAGTASPSGTTIPSATSITDGSGNVYTLNTSGGHVSINGTPDGSNTVDTVLYYSGGIYYHTTDGTWFSAFVPFQPAQKIAGDPRPPPPPTAVPGAVTNLAIAGASSSGYTITWSAPTTGGAVATYTLLSSPTAGGTFSTLVSGITGTGYSLSGLSSSSTAYYEVSAVNSLGPGPLSGSVAGTTAAAGSPSDTFGSGVHITSDVWINSNSSFSPLGQGIVRGLVGQPTITVLPAGTTTAAQAKYFAVGGGCSLFWIGRGGSDVTPYWDITIQAVDGVNTYTAPVRVHNAAAVSQYTNPVVMESQVCFTNTLAGADQDNPTLKVFSYVARYGASMPGSIGMTTPSGYFQYSNVREGSYPHPGFETTATSNTILDSITGIYPVTLTSDSGISQPMQVLIAKEQPAVIAFTPVGTIWDWQYALEAYPQTYTDTLSLIGSIGLYLDTANAITPAYNQQITSSDGTIVYGYLDGGVRAVAPLTAGTHNFTFSATAGVTGTVTNKSFSYTVLHGNLLAASAVAVALTPSLTNAMTSATVATFTATGGVLTGVPKWNLAVVGYEPQDLTSYDYPNPSPPTPRYVIHPAADGMSATLSATYLSAQTDNLVVQVSDAAGNCWRQPVTITASDAVPSGLTLNVGTGQTYTREQDAIAVLKSGSHPGTLVFYPGDYSTGWDYYPHPATPPGPYAYIGSGGSAASRAALDFKGAGGGQRCGVEMNQFDGTLKYLDIRNTRAGTYNTSAVRKVAQSPGNWSIIGCAVSNSNNGIAEGDCASHCVIQDTWVGYSGDGGGYTHNLYLDTNASVTISNLLSFGVNGGHAFKSRANRVTITGSRIIDCEDGSANGSSLVDFPEGGDISITSTTLQLGPNPSNAANLISFMEEVGTPGGSLAIGRKVTNRIVLDGVTFLNTAASDGSPAGAPIYGVYINNGGGNALSELSTITGSAPTLTYKNCLFYNIPKSRWIRNGLINPAASVVDGGGNVALTTWPGLLPTDPGTGATIANPPQPHGWLNSAATRRINGSPLKFAYTIPVGAAAGTLIDNMFVTTAAAPYGGTGYSWAIQKAYRVQFAGDQAGVNAAGVFAIDANSGAFTVAGSTVDGLYMVYLYSNSYAFGEWRFVVCGSGTVPAAA